MNSGELIEWVKNRSVEYREVAADSIKRNQHMNHLGGQCRLTQDEIDAILTDFVNYCGSHQGIDYAMYTRDMKNDKGNVLS